MWSILIDGTWGVRAKLTVTIYMHFVAIFLNKKLVPIRLKPNRIIILAKEVDPVLVVFK